MMPPEPRLQGVPGHQTTRRPICVKKFMTTPRPMKNSNGSIGAAASCRFPSRRDEDDAEKGLSAGPAPAMEKKK